MKTIMKKNLRIKSKYFISWMFNTGADQEQETMALDLGRMVIERLSKGSVTITPQDILDECEPIVIPLNIVEGFEDDDTFDEIEDAIKDGRISKDFEIKLV
jgi:hypothetical protein